MWWLASAAVAQVWVASTDGSLQRFDRLMQRAERRGVQVEPLHLGARCLTFDGEGPDPKWQRRIERKLGRPLQERLDCAIARYPMGRGWVVAVVGPHSDLKARVADVVRPLTMSVVTEPLDGRPATVCVSGLQMEYARLKHDLQVVGLFVEGVYEVGGCDAPAARRSTWVQPRR